MNCDDFSEWLQVQLDQRSNVILPSEMAEHLNECESCRGQVEAWNRIASIMPNDSATILAPAPVASWTTRQTIVAVASIAAVALVSFLVGFGNSDEADTPQAVAMASVQSDRALVRLSDVNDANVNPVVLWKKLQSRDWISETMPTVQSVRDGMAPLGRSFTTAVNILTMGNRERPS